MALSDQVKQAIAIYLWGADGDDAAFATATTAIEYFDGGHEDLLVRKTPIMGITEVFNVSASSTVTATTYDYYTSVGSIYRKSGAEWGSSGKRRQFKVTYTYGFTSIPDDIQLAIDTWVNYLTADNTGALKSYKTGDDSESYSDAVSTQGMPATVKNILQRRRRLLF